MNSNKIRIVHLIPSFERAGAEAVVSNICNFLSTELYEIHIVLLFRSTSGLVKIREEKKVTIHVADGFPFKIENNIPRFRYKSLRLLRQIIKSINPDIIHSHLFEAFLSLNLWLISIGNDYKFIHTAHSNSSHYKNNELISQLGLKIERAVFKKINARFVCVSFDMLTLMRKHFSLENLDVVRNSVNTDFYCRDIVVPYDLQKLDISPGTFTLIHIGRFAEVKNHTLMFEALSILKHKGICTVLICLGYRGGLWEKYQSLIFEKGLNDYIRFVGEVDDTRPYIAACQLGVFPSFHEGLSMALLEMFSMEMPVLLSRIPSFEEITKSVTEKLFIDEHNPELLATKIEEVITSINDFVKIGKDMRAEVINSFSVVNQVSKYEELYNKLLNN